jgi:hypothetical protein
VGPPPRRGRFVDGSSVSQRVRGHRSRQWLYRAVLNADNAVMGRNRGGRGIPRWIIVPNVLGFGGRTRMAGQSEFGRHPHRTPAQRLHVVYAAAIAGAVFAILVGLVWVGVWLLRLVL